MTRPIVFVAPREGYSVLRMNKKHVILAVAGIRYPIQFSRFRWDSLARESERFRRMAVAGEA